MQPVQPVIQQQTRAVGRRVAAQRTSLGLSQEAVALRAGMTTSYLQYVEEQGGVPSANVLRRLAEVLHTTREDLAGELSAYPIAPTVANPGTVVTTLDDDECRLLLGSVPVGRVAFAINGPPLVLPVNFTLMGHEIVIQTAAMSPLAELARADRLVSFEVDEIDEQSRLGWSVLCHGPARISTGLDGDELHVVDLVRPWIGGDRRTVVVITPTRVTGRRIGLA